MHSYIGEMFKWLVSLLVILLIMCMGTLFIKANEASDFQHQANSIIQDTGTINPNTKAKDIHNESLSSLSKHYNDMFTVVSNSRTKAGASKRALPYGTTIDYDVTAHIHVLDDKSKTPTINMSELNSHFRGVAESQVGFQSHNNQD